MCRATYTTYISHEAPTPINNNKLTLNFKIHVQITWMKDTKTCSPTRLQWKLLVVNLTCKSLLRKTFFFSLKLFRRSSLWYYIVVRRLCLPIRLDLGTKSARLKANFICIVIGRMGEVEFQNHPCHTIRKRKNMVGQDTSQVLLLNDANMIGEHYEKRMKML